MSLPGARQVTMSLPQWYTTPEDHAEQAARLLHRLLYLIGKNMYRPLSEQNNLRPGAEARAANLKWSSWSAPAVLSAWCWAGLMVPTDGCGLATVLALP